MKGVPLDRNNKVLDIFEEWERSIQICKDNNISSVNWSRFELLFNDWKNERDILLNELDVCKERLSFIYYVRKYTTTPQEWRTYLDSEETHEISRKIVMDILDQWEDHVRDLEADIKEMKRAIQDVIDQW